MYSKLSTKLVSVLQADDTLTSLLASSEAIYYHRPPKERSFPCLTFTLEDTPSPAHSEYGRFELVLQIDIWGTSPDVNDQIMDALDSALFDAHRDSGLDTTNWSVKHCRRFSTEIKPAGAIESDTGLEVERRRTRWLIFAYQKNA